MEKSITIVGAGLAGSLLSLYLARRGYQIEILESRPDIRIQGADPARSINLALSCRGLTALAAIGLADEVRKILVPMRARAIHLENGRLEVQPFGRHQGEYINAVQRNDLNALLLTRAESTGRVKLHFHKRLISVDFEGQRLHFRSEDGQEGGRGYARLIGADGAASPVRECLTRQSRIRSTRTYLSHGYKELSLYSAESGGFLPEHLHLWPRDSFLLLGNPNLDGSMTGSLFLPNEGKNSFAELASNEEKICSFFCHQFRDAYEATPGLLNDFLNHPTGTMSTVHTEPWHDRDQCLLIGDAAHGVVPFFGQGMNSAFEDCRILSELLEEHQDDWGKVMPVFSQSRKQNTDAVAQMSLENYHEIQSDIRDAKFNLKKHLEQELMHRYPNRYISKHVMVMFTNTPYAQAFACGKLQAEFLNRLCSGVNSVDDVQWKDVDGLMLSYEKQLASYRN